MPPNQQHTYTVHTQHHNEDTRIEVINAALIQYQGYATDLSNPVLAGRAFKGKVTDELYKISLHTKQRIFRLSFGGLAHSELTAMLG